MKIDAFKNKKTLIAGEVNTGKTSLTARILEAFLSEGKTQIAIIDMAPERVRKAGGKIPVKTSHRVRYYSARIRPPRLSGKSETQVENLARQNASVLSELLDTCMKRPPRVLFINDVSIYLQAGDPASLLRLIDTIPTVVMNGYFGRSLGGGLLSERERQNMKYLQKHCDNVILLKREK